MSPCIKSHFTKKLIDTCLAKKVNKFLDFIRFLFYKEELLLGKQRCDKQKGFTHLVLTNILIFWTLADIKDVTHSWLSAELIFNRLILITHEPWLGDIAHQTKLSMIIGLIMGWIYAS